MAPKKKNDTAIEPVGNFRIITTDDIALAKSIILNKFENTHGKIRFISDLESSHHLFTSNSFLDKTKKCFVCKNIESLIKSEDLWDSIISGKFLNGHALVFICDKLDSRTKFAKKFKPFIFTVNTESLDVSTIVGGSVVNLSRDNRDKLFKQCLYNVTKFESEFNKIEILYDAYEGQYSFDDIYEMIDSSGGFVNMVSDDMFKLSSYIMKQQIDKTYAYLDAIGDYSFNFGLLTVLYNNFRNLYIYGCAKATGRLESTGMNSFQQKSCENYLQFYTSKRLINILAFLQKLDFNIKSGKIDSNYALEYMLCGVFS